MGLTFKFCRKCATMRPHKNGKCQVCKSTNIKKYDIDLIHLNI